MASIVSHTYKTFDNLKIIESLLKGVAKSKGISHPHTPTSHINRYRSKSVENDLFFYPNHPQKIIKSKFYGLQLATDTRTVKKGYILQKYTPLAEKSSTLEDIGADSI